MKKALTGLALFALAGCVFVSAISSEPVYIKGYKNMKDFKLHLEKLVDLMDDTRGLLGSSNPLATLIEGESPKFEAIRLGDEATRFEVTKIYRQLDASRKSLLTKGVANNNALVAKISETIKYIEILNNIKG